MFRNYLLTAWRNMTRNKAFSIINIAGLAVGISVSILIFMVIQFELSFDKFHAKQDRTYRVLSAFSNADGTNYNGGVPYPVATALRVDFPQLHAVSAICQSRNNLFTIVEETKSAGEQKKFREGIGVFFLEPEFFKIFDFKWLAGDAKSALADPGNAVLSKSVAEKYFGSWQNAVGKTILRENNQLLKISGILDDVPSNTDFQIRVAIPYAALEESRSTDWRAVFSENNNFVVLPENMSEQSFNNLLVGFVKKHAEDSDDRLVLQPLSMLHYDDRTANFLGRVISQNLINSLSVIAVFILIIACVNFVNLTTAQAVNRSKEVGVRKVLGGNKLQLAWQFLSETAIITITALIVALLIAMAVLPSLSRLLELPLQKNMLFSWEMMLFLVFVPTAVILLSGFYPAIVISGFNPITALKNKVASLSTRGLSLRRGLVVIQFVIAQVLIIGTIIVVEQMNFFRSKPLGFNKESIVSVPLPQDSISRTKYENLKTRLQNVVGVKKISLSYANPTDNGNWYSPFRWNNASENADFSANMKWADADYFDTYEFEFVAGRPYRKSDTVTEFVVSERFLSRLGIRDPQEAIGKQITMSRGRIVAPVVGVVRDFHAQSLQEELVPVILASNRSNFGTINVKLDPASVKKAMDAIEKEWTATYPEYLYEFQFLDDKIASFYTQENQLSQLYKVFAAIAIFISCLGLYGLASFMAAQRIKEVGIRKVLGASIASIVYLFSKEFIALIVIAFFIAFPIAYFVMKEWLQEFEYRIDLYWWIFALAAILAIVIALMTISFQALRAAVVSPVKSLRSE